MLAASLGLACAEVPNPDIAVGIVARGGDFVVRGDDHLVELLVHEGHVYVANSNLAAGALRLEPDGGLTTTDPGQPYAALIRCTSLAVHAPSDTLYCGADEPFDADVATVRIADISTPGAIRWRGAFELARPSTRDLEVVGDRLLISQFHHGLWTAAIGPDGELAQLNETGVEGNVRVSVAVGDRVVSLLGDVEGPGAELRLLDPTDWSELDRLSLSGPPLGLSADVGGAPRVAVGLGSGGMELVDVEADELRLARLFEPPAVVSAGLVDGEIAAAVTLSGVFAWSIAGLDAGEDPRLFGFGPSGTLAEERAGNMLHGVIHDGEIFTSDWIRVGRWALDPAGEVVDLDVPRGIYVGAEGPVRWRMRNPGALALRVEFWIRREYAFETTIGPGELVEVELPQALRERALADEPVARVFVRAYAPAVPSEGAPLSSTVLTLVQRDPDATLPPATGDRFPALRLAELDLEQTYDFPLAEGSQTIWIWPDCAMIWPQIEDLAWLRRAGVELGRGTPVVLSEFDLEADEFAAQWGLDGLRFGIWGPVAPPDVDETNAAFGDNLYDPFFISEMPGDAMPTDYVIGPDATIRSIERMYRSRWTLVVPWPWT